MKIVHTYVWEKNALMLGIQEKQIYIISQRLCNRNSDNMPWIKIYVPYIRIHQLKK